MILRIVVGLVCSFAGGVGLGWLLGYLKGWQKGHTAGEQAVMHGVYVASGVTTDPQW